MTTKTSILLFSIIVVGFTILGISYIWNVVHGSISASPFNTSEKDTNLDTGWFEIKALLKIHTDEFYGLDEGYYDVKKFAIVLPNSSQLCPTNDCEFSFKHAAFAGFQIWDDYNRNFEGTLKVKKDGKSIIYKVEGFYQVAEIESDKQVFTGETKIYPSSETSVSRDHIYQTNGTLVWKNDRKNADLSLRGDKVE